MSKLLIRSSWKFHWRRICEHGRTD